MLKRHFFQNYCGKYDREIPVHPPDKNGYCTNSSCTIGLNLNFLFFLRVQVSISKYFLAKFHQFSSKLGPASPESVRGSSFLMPEIRRVNHQNTTVVLAVFIEDPGSIYPASYNYRVSRRLLFRTATELTRTVNRVLLQGAAALNLAPCTPRMYVRRDLRGALDQFTPAPRWALERTRGGRKAQGRTAPEMAKQSGVEY
jgi:hypothetical protein